MKSIPSISKSVYLGVLLLCTLLLPTKTFSQGSTDFTIAQVIINSCAGYIEVSVQADATYTISYEWYEKDSSGNYVLIPNEIFRTLFASPGDYRIIVTNQTTGEQLIRDFVLNASFDLTIGDLFSGLVCSNDLNSGAILAYLNNGTSPYSYALLDSIGTLIAQGTTEQGDEVILIENIPIGTYTLEWTDNLSCSGSATIEVEIPDELTATATSISPICFGETGGLTFSIDGGWGPDFKAQLLNESGIPVTLTGFTAISTEDGDYYDVGNGQNISVSGLPAGIYTLKFFDQPLNNQFINRFDFDVTRTTSCIRSIEIEIEEPDELLARNEDVIINNSSCNGADDGSIQLTASGGTAPYTFAWTASNGGLIPAGQGTTNTLTGLTPGTYELTITDVNGCEFTGSYDITQPSQLTFSLDSFTNISCNGGFDGEIVLQVDGGTPNYEFFFNGVAETPTSNSGNLYTFSALSADNYIITVTDNNSCTTIPTDITQSLSEPPPIAITTNDFLLNCFGNSDGVINGTISGGTAPYTIVNNQTNQSITVSTDGGSFSFSGLAFGNYTFTVTDSSSSGNCSTTTSAEVSQPDQISATDVTTNISCFGNNDGAIVLSPSGGTSPYNYAWSTTNGIITPGEETTNSISNLPPGTYNVTITDNNGCDITNSYTVNEPAEIGLSATTSMFDAGTGSPINISCNGASDGTITATPVGGTAPYTFVWTASNGGVIPAGQSNNQSLTGLPAGTYAVQVSDVNNCSTSDSFDLVEPRLLSGSAAVIQDNDCFNGSLGIIETTIDSPGSVDGIAYTYTITGANLPSGYVASETTSALSQQFETLPAGTYQVTVADSNGCAFTTAALTVGQPSNPITISETISNFNGFNISCFGNVDASITVSVTGGSPGSGVSPYTYQWTSPSGATIPVGQENTNSLSGIGSGTYELTVTDGTGICSISEIFIISEPSEIILSGVTSNYNGFGVSAAGALDGSIDLTVAGGVDTQAYTYSWSTTDGIIPSGQENNEDLSGLTAGTYSVIITDANGCPESISITLTEPDELLISEDIASHQNVDCFGDSTGVIEIEINQESIGPYQYDLLLGGTILQNAITIATSYRFENLNAGTYDIHVTDANGATATINGIVVSQPASAFTSTISTSLFTGPNGTFEVSCFGNTDGVIDILLSGGTPFDQGLPSAYYTYSLSNSSGTVIDSGQGVSISISNLAADTYTFTALDATGNCPVDETISISEPNELIITTDAFLDIQCFGANDGSIEVTISGGLGNNSITWTKDGNAFSTSEDINNLTEGNYILLVEDSVANSCSASESYTITEPSEFNVTLDSKTDLSCFGGTDGEINVSIVGGTPIPGNPNQYQFDWVHDSGATYNTKDLTAIPAGIYNLTVTDANGCIDTLQVTLTQPSEILVNSIKTDISCYDYNDGSITINPSGGVAPYSISWSDLGSGTIRTNLSAGIYTVTITDNTGCSTFEDIEIIDAPIFSLQGSTSSDISCFGENDGSINLVVTGGVAPLQLNWSDGSTAGIQRNNLGAGTYGVEIISADGCVQNAEFIIIEPQELAVNAVVTDPLDCSNVSSGSIDLTVLGGTPPYTFAWNNGATTEDLIDVPPNNYSVTITDINGCSISDTYQIFRQEEIEVSLVTNIQSDCATKVAFQESELIISGGFPPYNISWSYGTVDSTNPAIMRTDISGVAVATIIDNLGCLVTQNVPVDVQRLGDPSFTMNSIFYTDYSIWAIDDPIAFTNTSTGDPQSYLWSFGDGNTSTEESPTHTYVREGTYLISLTVFYAYGCSYTTQKTIVVGDGYEIEIPNAFTPNNDGVNDVFRPVYLGMKEVKMSVYDTWGGLLYSEASTTNIFNGWDGFVDGKPAENGNYIYQVEAISRNDIKIAKTGPLTLIK